MATFVERLSHLNIFKKHIAFPVHSVINFEGIKLRMDYFQSQCSHCPKVFTSEIGLKKHKFEIHYSVENVYDCEQCGKEFQRPH